MFVYQQAIAGLSVILIIMKSTPKIILILFSLLLLGAACQKPPATTVQQGTDKTSTDASANTSPATSSDLSQPPLLIKHLGVELGDFDPATGMAGDFKFTRNKLDQKRLWMDYGYVIPAGDSATGQDKPNPQPTFVLPLGTKVHSLVDGVVVAIPELYSHDFSIQVGVADKDSVWRYETEHVINPTVKVGDRVTAGQVIAEVSTWSFQGNDGLGMVEIGILRGGNPPEHICPFAYLDPSVKDQLQSSITKMYASWESYRGDTALYDEAAMPVIGCQTLDPIAG